MIEIQTGKIIIVDPSRRKDIWSKLIIDECENGFWGCEKTVTNGVPEEFMISLNGRAEADTDWIQVDHEIFTNSKHITISDYGLFPENGFRDIFEDIRAITGDLDDEDVEAIWSNDYAYATLHNHTNWDIGSHTCYMKLNKNAKVVAIKIIFK